MVRINGFKTSVSVLAACVAAFAGSAAQAGDSGTGTTANTALLAYLGLDAASGKSTLGDGGGQIEAWTLSTPAINQAGAMIADAAGSTLPAPGKFVVLTTDQTVNFITPQIFHARLDDFGARMATAPCGPAQMGFAPMALGEAPGAAAVTPADIIGALKTDKTISGVTITPTDTTLVNAVVVAMRKKNIDGVVPSEIVAPDASSLAHSMQALTVQAAAITKCKTSTPEQKTAASEWADFVKVATTRPSGGGNTPLEDAAAYYDLAVSKPLVVRVHIEKAGGTAITRSNIWYSLGFPGAITISAGLIVSYRIVDPATGSVFGGGLLRCKTKPVPINAAASGVPHADCESLQ